MSGLLSYFWGASSSNDAANTSATESNGAAATSQKPSTDATRTPTTHTPSASLGQADEFVMIDTPMAVDATATPAPSPAETTSVPEVAEPAAPTPATSEEPTATVPMHTSSSRSCRLYGHARFPPARIPTDATTTTTAPAAPSPQAKAPATKRSFADALKTKSSSSDAQSHVVAFGQDASLSVAEAVLAKIEQLQQQIEKASPPVPRSTDEGEVENVLASLQTDSPPLKPMTLSRDSARRYDASTEWTLGVDEPHSKRSKRAASPTKVILTKLEAAQKAKGKSKQNKRIDEKAMRHARDDKTAVGL